MAPKVLKEFVINCSIDKFVESFWQDRGWYERFLSEKLLDISVDIGEWGPATVKPESAFTRNVKSYHPSKISFPGLPSHAEVISQPSLLCLLSFTYDIRFTYNPFYSLTKHRRMNWLTKEIFGLLRLKRQTLFVVFRMLTILLSIRNGS